MAVRRANHYTKKGDLFTTLLSSLIIIIIYYEDILGKKKMNIEARRKYEKERK